MVSVEPAYQSSDLSPAVPPSGLVGPSGESIPTPSRDYLLYHKVCPMGVRADGLLSVAVEPDSVLTALDELAVAYGRSVHPEPWTARDLHLHIERLTSGEPGLHPPRGTAEDDGTQSDIRDLVHQPPVVRYVNLLIQDGHEAGASDIHLEATRGGLRARYRIDGVLQPALPPPPGMDRAVVSRVKLLADLDIAERRRPQDGRIRVRLETRELDLRVSTVPNLYGESVVLRLMDRTGRPSELPKLGLSAEFLETLTRLVVRPHGLILVTGPTGSGKTTTLYAALGLRNGDQEKIITLEDPVEFPLDSVIQVPVHRQTGVTFGSMLRSILRQDPDVLMVGEMRDGETAELAVQAALTGHMVFSTLHTNDALGAIPRLLDLGVPAFLVAATLDAVLAQRLVRRTCENCREPYTPDPAALEGLEGPIGPLSRGVGCAQCRHTGYQGRIGLFELLAFTQEMRDAVAAGVPRRELHALAASGGQRSLRIDGWAKAQAGLTTVEEVLRVTQE